MLKTINITSKNILHQLKLSYKIPEIIEQIVTIKLIENAAIEADIKVETEELQKAADQIRLANKLNSAIDTLTWLKQHGLSLDNFEQIVYNNLISRKLATHLFADKVEPYFFVNQLDYTEVAMYEVILDDEDLAFELFYAIKEGEMSFYDIAHKYIQERELSRKGGYQGIVRRKDLKPEISAAVFAAKPPQILKPILSSSGVHLILVEEIIQPILHEKLSYKIMLDLFSEWIKQQSQEVEVLLNLEL